MVSRSRISPTRITSGSWRKAARSAVEKFAVSTSTSRWLMKLLLVAVQEFDGVFDGDDVIGARGVDAVDHGRQRGGFARAGRSGHQHQAALLLADLVDDARQVQFLRGANFRRDDAQNHADVAALLEDVDAEAAQARHAIGHIQLGGFLEFLLLAVGHHAERHREHLFRA